MKKEPENGCVKYEPAERVCRCFASPSGTSFEKNGIYNWEFGIDCIIVKDKCGMSWYGDELEFASRFQRLNGREKSQE